MLVFITNIMSDEEEYQQNKNYETLLIDKDRDVIF